MAQLETGTSANRCNLIDNGDFHLGTTEGFEKNESNTDGLSAVSYTHLDVYKRQDVDLVNVISRRDDSFSKKTPQNQFSQMLWDTDQFHGQTFIYIYIHHVFHKD